MDYCAAAIAKISRSVTIRLGAPRLQQNHGESQQSGIKPLESKQTQEGDHDAGKRMNAQSRHRKKRDSADQRQDADAKPEPAGLTSYCVHDAKACCGGDYPSERFAIIMQ
jgi:hypothetical protein